MRKVSASEWTGPWPPWTGTQITFGPKRTKPSEEELAKREDKTMRHLEALALMQDDPKLKEQYQQEADNYWAGRRKELGLQEE